MMLVNLFRCRSKKDRGFDMHIDIASHVPELAGVEFNRIHMNAIDAYNAIRLITHPHGKEVITNAEYVSADGAYVTYTVVLENRRATYHVGVYCSIIGHTTHTGLLPIESLSYDVHVDNLSHSATILPHLRIGNQNPPETPYISILHSDEKGAMCGIFAYIGCNGKEDKVQCQATRSAFLQKHRGPDGDGLYAFSHGVLVHSRLAVMAPASGPQPLKSQCGKVRVCVNGEIYNYANIIYQCMDAGYDAPESGSDCEAILLAYMRWGVAFPVLLDGIFSAVIVDERDPLDVRIIIVRDHIGIVPLYVGRTSDNGYVYASEMKCLLELCGDHTIQQFPPGSVQVGHFKQTDHHSSPTIDFHPACVWYTPLWLTRCNSTALALEFQHSKFEYRYENALYSVKHVLENAVKKQLMSDTPFGVLLSGGLDSSLVAALAARELRLLVPECVLHTFSIGLMDSPDLKYARDVAEYLGTQHHEFVYTVNEGIDVLPSVIWHIETYDVTTVRASVPMYLLSKRIKQLGFNMVLSGEGSDEMFGGYLYFHKAPNDISFQNETVLKMSELHKYDCLRCNKSMSAWGVEARVPFLDKDFVDTVMNIHPSHRMCGIHGHGRIEKHLLRAAFEQDNLLPHSVLWRQKEQFSDGVGYNWIDNLKAKAELEVGDVELDNANAKFPINTPLTKEAYMYRRIFARLFSSDAASSTVPGGPSIACSSANAVTWCKSDRNCTLDASGRSVGSIHHSLKDLNEN